MLANELVRIQSKERIPLLLPEGQTQRCHVRAINSHLGFLGNQSVQEIYDLFMGIAVVFLPF